MTTTNTPNRGMHAFLSSFEGSLAADALAMPVHWYYDRAAWLERYIACMHEPGWHRDTYVEEDHRAFFTRYAQGKAPTKCGISDEHIGGLATVPALIAALEGTPREELRRCVQQHVGLTHAHDNVLRAADTLVRLIWAASTGVALREALRHEAGDWLSGTKATAWCVEPDERVIGERFSPACYIAEAMPAALYLAWKYHDDFTAGITANAMVGGDNCHRGAVVGSLLGAACGVPERFQIKPDHRLAESPWKPIPNS